MKYELIHEIFNKCSGNQMRDVFVSELDTDDPEQYVRNVIKGKITLFDKNEASNGDVVIDVDVDGLRQRFGFSRD